MNLDVIIGNPPYNDDIYLEFVKNSSKKAHKLSSMIIPAKWHLKDDKLNNEIREDLYKYSDKIVYYPNAYDVFNIQLTCGVCYYLRNRNESNYKEIINICKVNDKLCGKEKTNSINRLYLCKYIEDKIRSIDNSSLNRVINTYTRDFINNDNYAVMMNNVASGGGLLYNGSTFVTEPSEVIIEGNTEKKNVNAIWFRGTEEECKSFKSYIDTRLIRFIIFMHLYSKCISWEVFKYIPDPVKFDHIFTDTELYNKYRLDNNDIETIETLIKER